MGFLIVLVGEDLWIFCSCLMLTHKLHYLLKQSVIDFLQLTQIFHYRSYFKYAVCPPSFGKSA